MTIHEKVRALVSEFSDEYVVVMRADNQLSVSVSDIEFAKSSIEDIQEAISGWCSQEDAKNRKHHHKHDTTPPGKDKKKEED